MPRPTIVAHEASEGDVLVQMNYVRSTKNTHRFEAPDAQTSPIPVIYIRKSVMPEPWRVLTIKVSPR